MTGSPGSGGFTAEPSQAQPDWELDYYSRPIVEADGRKRWELLICATPQPGDQGATEGPFRWVRPCGAGEVNSLWLREALSEALAESDQQGRPRPRRVRCWRGSMRSMVQRAADAVGLEMVASRRCYALVEWLQQRQAEVYPLDPGYQCGPLAPPPLPIRPVPVPLPEVARGERWAWATLPAAALADCAEWSIDFAGLLRLPPELDPQVPVPGIRLFSRHRALAMAGWLAGLEPVRLEVVEDQLVLEAGLEDRWLLTGLAAEEAAAARTAFAEARQRAGGLQFIAIQADEGDPRLEGFWLLRDLPDG